MVPPFALLQVHVFSFNFPFLWYAIILPSITSRREICNRLIFLLLISPEEVETLREQVQKCQKLGKEGLRVTV